MNKRGPYHAYTDGSVFNGGCHGGAGWVIYTANGNPVARSSRRITETPRATTTLAEIYAATDALNRIAAQSAIVLHTDDQDLCRVLTYTATIDDRINRHSNKPALRDAYAALYLAVVRHDSVTAVFADAAVCPRMREAHNLAREGAFSTPRHGSATMPRGAAAMAPR